MTIKPSMIRSVGIKIKTDDETPNHGREWSRYHAALAEHRAKPMSHLANHWGDETASWRRPKKKLWGVGLAEYAMQRFDSIKGPPKLKTTHMPETMRRRRREQVKGWQVIDAQLAAWRDAERAAGRWPPSRS